MEATLGLLKPGEATIWAACNNIIVLLSVSAPVLQTMSDMLKAYGKALVLDPERTKDPVDFVQRLLQVIARCLW